MNISMAANPSVTYIVSCFDRPNALRGVLASLQVQTDADFEVIVSDRGSEPAIREQHMRMVENMQDTRFRHKSTALLDPPYAQHCYWNAAWIVEHEARGEWICLPSDDSYYMPIFQEACLTRARAAGWQLVFPEMLYDRRLRGDRYSVLDTRICSGGIDKTGFLLRRDAWIGFPTLGQGASDDCCDGEMIVAVAARGAKWGKIDEILAIHN